MSRIADGIKRRLRESGKTQAELASHLGVNQSTISRMLAGAQKIDADQVQEIENFLGQPLTNQKLPERHPNGTIGREGATLARDLPILGAARGGDHGVFLDNGSHFGMTYRPPQLNGVSNAYSVLMVGDSMSGKYEPGDELWVNPHKPPRQGRNVVIQLAPEEAGGEMEFFVKTYVSWNDKELVCSQRNPKKEVRFPIERVHAVHLITGSWED